MILVLIQHDPKKGVSTGILCSLRWHYPDQVKGLISARHLKAPQILCKGTRKNITFTYIIIYISTYMQFKQLDIKPLDIKHKGNWFTRTINSPRFRTTITAIVIGAVLGFLFFYFTEGRLMESIPGREIVKSLLIGGFFGFFITNSPCARGRC